MAKIRRNNPCLCGSGKKYMKYYGSNILPKITSIEDSTGKGFLIKNNKSLRDHNLSWIKSNWSEHRKLVQSLLLEGNGRDRILIIGAGNCHDFDLIDISQMFNSVILVDYDHESVYEAVKPLPSKLKAKIEVCEFDVTGIYEELIPTYLERLNSFTIEEAKIQFENLIANLQPPSLPESLVSKKYDCIAFLGIFTQLLGKFFDNVIVSKKSSLGKKLRPLASELHGKLPEICFRAFLPIMSEQTQISLYVDYLEFRSSLEVESLGIDLIKAFQPETIDRYGISGAHATYEALCKVFNLPSDIHFLGWPWLFSRQKTYYVVGASFKFQAFQISN